MKSIYNDITISNLYQTIYKEEKKNALAWQ